MIAVLWAELTDWKQVESRRSLILLTLSLGVVFLITMARPDWCLVALTANMLWLSLRAGQGEWSEASPEDWLNAAGLKPWQVVAGKMAAVFVLNLLQLGIALPMLTALTVLWGIPMQLFANLALLWLGSTWLAALLPLSFYKLGEYGELLATALLGGWLLISLMINQLAIYNPLIQVYRVMQGEEIRGYQWLAVYFALTALLAGLLICHLRKAVQPR